MSELISKGFFREMGKKGGSVKTTRRLFSSSWVNMVFKKI